MHSMPALHVLEIYFLSCHRHQHDHYRLYLHWPFLYMVVNETVLLAGGPLYVLYYRVFPEMGIWVMVRPAHSLVWKSRNVPAAQTLGASGAYALYCV